MNTALLFFGLVAALSVITYGYNLTIGVTKWRGYRDDRARHDAAIDAGLFICSLTLAASILLVFIEAGSVARFGISALFMGAFLATGIIIVSERRNRRKGGSGGARDIPPPYDPAGNH